tara:strand:- start:109 stop:462 length:354 start_codon:yes stop_codon:yes gene_type:complete
MKKKIENEIEELLAKIEDNYQNQNKKFGIMSFITNIKQLNLFRLILIIVLVILLITNGFFVFEGLIFFSLVGIALLVGYILIKQYSRPVKRWRGKVIKDYYPQKNLLDNIKDFFTKK